VKTSNPSKGGRVGLRYMAGRAQMVCFLAEPKLLAGLAPPPILFHR
ncbi:uncharacterized protein METZ01_LOCUS204861, partial [marine metagenome]